MVLIEPIATRKIFLCWDKLRSAALFNISIKHSKKYTNMSIRDFKMLKYLAYNNNEENTVYYLQLIMSITLMNRLLGNRRSTEYYNLIIKKHVRKKAALNYILEKLHDKLLIR